jgi:hypothetical protein
MLFIIVIIIVLYYYISLCCAATCTESPGQGIIFVIIVIVNVAYRFSAFVPLLVLNPRFKVFFFCISK